MGGKPRLQSAFRTRLWDTSQAEANSFAPRRLPGLSEAQVGRRFRFLLLSLDADADMELLQVIYNEPSKFAPISKKVSTVRGEGSVEYTVMLEFYELGDNLPVSRTKDDLVAAYAKSKSVESLHAAFDMGSDAQTK